MTAVSGARLLHLLTARGWNFTVEGGRLLFDAPEGPHFDAELSAVRAHKESIISAISESLVPSFPTPLCVGKEGTNDDHATPLDAEVATFFADRYGKPHIDRRIAKLELDAALPSPHPLKVIALADWRQLRAACKEQ